MNIDKHIKDKFNEQTFEFKEEYWQSASALIDKHQKNKKNRILIWWSSISGSLLLLGIAMWMFFSNTKNSKTGLVSLNNTEHQAMIKTSDAKLNSISSKSETTVNAVTNNVQNKDGKTNGNQVRSSSEFNSNNMELLKSDQTENVSASKRFDQPNTISSSQSTTTQYKLQNPMDEKMEAHVEHHETEKSVLTWDNDAMNSLGILPFKPLVSDIRSKNIESKPRFFIPYFSIGMYTGVHSSQRNIKTMEQLNPALKEKKTAEEHVQSSYNFGVEGQYYFKPQWSVSFGAEYMNYVEHINYTGIQKEKTQYLDHSFFDIKDSSYWSGGWVMVDSMPRYYQNTSYHIVKDSTFIENIDTTVSTYVDESIRALNGQNRYTYIEIPLLIGYQFPYKSFEIQVQSGLSMGFLQSYQTKYAVDNQDYNNQSLVTVKQQVSNLIMRISVIYPLSRQTYIYLQPAYKTQMTNSVEVTGGFTQRFTSYHVNLGVRYLFR